MEYKSPRVRMRDVSRIYDALEVGIIITTGSGTIIWGNRYYSQLAQFDIRDYFGHNVREISRREDVILPTMNYIIDIVLQTRQQQTEIVQYRTEDYVLTTATPIFDKNNHDCTKYLELDEQLQLCAKYGIVLDELEQQAVKLLHSKTGACVARHVYGVSDDIYEAIFWHTTGKADMSLLDN